MTYRIHIKDSDLAEAILRKLHYDYGHVFSPNEVVIETTVHFDAQANPRIEAFVTPKR